MVPVVELGGLPAQDNTPPNTLPMEFPSWTRADDNDNVPNTISTKLRRRTIVENAQGDKKRDDDVFISATATTLLGTRIENRGFLKNIAEPVISGIFNAFDPNKHGSGPDSSDDENKKKGKPPKPAPIQTDLPPDPTPELPSPTSTASPASPASPTLPPPPPPPPPPPSASNPGNPSLPTTTYKPPQPTGGVVNPIQSPPGNSVSSSQVSSMKFSTLSPSSVQITRPTTMTSRSLFSLTPIVTASVPALSSGARKGVDFPPTLEPIVTLTTSSSPTSPTSTSNTYPTPDSDSAKDYYHDHNKGNVHPKVEKALIALGSVGATIIIGFLAWLLWRCYKRRRGIESSNSRRAWKTHIPKNMSMDKPKLLVTNALSRVPIIKNRIGQRDRGWANLGEADLGPFNEKGYVAQSLAQQPTPAIVVQTDFVRSSIHADNPQSGTGRHAPKESISSLEPQFNNTLRSGAQLPNSRLSDISSLSSGFGDGQFIIDTLNSNTNTLQGTASEATIKAPLPVAKRESVGAASQRRDTVYTEASEDMPPRFRSVNSWVRQQTGRVTRAKQRDQASDTPPVPSLPPEQDFGLMMPDGEEPRRADSAIGYGVAK